MNDELSALNVLFTEFYYWVTVVIMFLIHVGFCLYEVGVSREKNKLNTLMKNAMLIPVITVSFFLFGWWIYFAFQNGPGITGGLKSAAWAEPFGELMGSHMGGQPADESLTTGDTATWARLNGVFWAAFLLFSWTAGSILSGAVIERIRSGAFWLLAVLVGSVTWVIDAAWGWSDTGWMVQKLGYHDAYASGVIHGLAGGSALAILIHLGPRIGRFRDDGTPRVIPAHNTWMIVIGMFLIFTGFWGFYAACNVPIMDIDPDEGRAFFSATTIYLTPTTLSAITVNFLMALTGGLFMGYMVSHGNPFWTFQGGLGGIIAASAGNDLYHPYQAFFVAILGVWCGYKLHHWVERKFKIDDAVWGRCHPRLLRGDRRGRCGIHPVGLSQFRKPRLCVHYALGAVGRSGDHVFRPRVCAVLHCGMGFEEGRRAAYPLGSRIGGTGSRDHARRGRSQSRVR